MFSTDSTEIFFSKLRSTGLNYILPSFSLNLTVRGGGGGGGGGGANKHCLLTFFISNLWIMMITTEYVECDMLLLWLKYLKLPNSCIP